MSGIFRQNNRDYLLGPMMTVVGLLSMDIVR